MSVKRIHVENHQQADDDVDNHQKNPVNSIPYEILAKIFMLLPIDELLIMGEVCNRWMEACQLAWHSIKKYKSRESADRDCDEYMLTQSWLEKVLSRCGSHLKELTISRAFDSSIMKFVADYCHNLTTLEFQFDIKKINNAINYYRAFTKLDKLKIINIKIHYDDNDEPICLFDAMNSCLSKNINEIHLSFFHVDDSYGCKKISPNFDLKKFKNLHRLSMRNCILKNMIQKISEVTKLVYLDIEGFEMFDTFSFEKPSFSLSPVSALSNLQHLEHLNLSGIKVLNDSDFIAIAKNCVNLNYLNIENMYFDIPGYPLMYLTDLKNLKTLIINWSYTFTDYLLHSLRGITTLHCFGCKYLTNIGISKLIKNCPDLENLVVGLNHKITKDIIVTADHVTRDRTNNIILHLKTYSENEKVDDYVIESQWLVHDSRNYFKKRKIIYEGKITY